MSYIGLSLDISLLYSVDRSLLADLPCEVLVQLPSAILDAKNLSFLVDPGYWFNDTEGDGAYLSCNTSQRIVCPDDAATLSTVSPLDDVCYLGTECLYPFVPSKYLTDSPGAAGMCFCGLDCRLRTTKLDIVSFDTTINLLCALCIVALSIYSVNVCTEYQAARSALREQHHAQSASTLSMDIPPVIAALLFLFLCCFNGPHATGNRTHFICEDGAEWSGQSPSSRVHSSTLWESNGLCFVFGVTTYFLMLLIINYFCLLSFVIYRYVHMLSKVQYFEVF